MSGTRLPTFTVSRLSVALNIPIERFSGWQRQGALNLLDAAPTTMGRGRQYTVRDIFQLAVIRHLVDHGVRLHHAAKAAHLAVNAYDKFTSEQVRTLELIFSAEDPRPLIRVSGPETEKPLPADAMLTVALNLPLLFALVRAAFAATEPPEKAAPILEFAQ